MKEIRADLRYMFYVKILLLMILVASLTVATTPQVKAVDGQASLKVEKTVDSVEGEPVVSFDIEKSVDKESITLDPEESEEVIYTINVLRNETASYTVSGTITAENTSDEFDALVTKVEDFVEYHVSGSEWTEVEKVTVFSGGPDSIPPEESKVYNYSITFTAPEGADQWRNVAEVTISNRGGGNAGEPYIDRESFDLPEPEVDGISADVEVTDEESIDPDDGGVSYEITSVSINGTPSSNLLGPWTVTPPETITIKKTITAAEDATPGKYTLDNLASIVDGRSDSAVVIITVPKEPEEPGDGGGQPSGGGGGDQVTAAETVQPAPTPAAVLPEVVAQAQPGPAPEVVAQAQAAPSPEQLPYTGLNSWYLFIAMLLITTGLFLQFVDVSKYLRKAK